MLQRIVHFSLKFRGVLIALSCVLLGYGLYVAAHSKLDVFPNFVPPQVEIQTEAPGLSPEQVEVLVTRPIETTVNGLGGMDSLRSESIQGLSVITAVFKEGTDIFVARQMLAEKLNEISGQLPVSVKTPRMSPLTSATMDLLKIGLVSDKLTPMQLRTLADWTVKPRLLSVPGVARCIVFGGQVREMQILAKPDRLSAYDLSISDVMNVAKLSTGVMGAGFVENANQRIVLQTEGQALSAEALGEVVIVRTNGLSVRLKDVAEVKEGPEPKMGDALIQGRPGVLMATASQYGANTMEVTLAVEAALREMQPIFDQEGVTLYSRLHRPATFIEVSLKNIKHSLYMGGILVGVVLFLFLGHFRTAFISLTAIPLSLLTAIILLDKFGITLNTITLGGLAIAIGEVVDDAIIDVENIFRRLRENQELAKPKSAFRVVLDASLEVRSAVVYATFVVALVFLPVLTLTGLQGSFFAPLALSYVFAIMASLAVALTVTPALSLIFFAKGVRNSKEPRLQVWLKRFYGRIITSLARWPKVVMAVVGIVCIAAVLMLPHFGSEFLPEFREGHFVLGVQMIPGTSLQEMLKMGKEISDELLKNKNIATVEQQVGRAEQGEDTFGSHRCEFHVELKPDVSGEDQETLTKEIRAVLEKYPGIQFEVMTFLGDRIGETITGETAPVVINVYGDDLDTIDEKARAVAQVLGTVKGAKDVQVKSPPGAPRMAVRLRPDRMTQFGFRPVDILEAVQTAYQGAVVAQVHEGDKVANVTVILDGANWREPEEVGSLLLKSAEGLQMPLNQLAEVYLTTGRYSIMHDGARRRQVVTCKPEGADVTSFTAEARKQIVSKVMFPKGTYAVFSGAAEATAKAQQQLLLNSAISAVGIIILLGIVTGNWKNLLLILANVPFALVGGILAVFLTTYFGDPGEGGLTIGSLVGFVTLFGITTRNSIMMISHFEHLVQVEGMNWSLETALRGASERLIPILMTAIVTALGLLPLAIGSGEAGREIEGPMAIVILGGLITSTVLNLLVLPTLALRFGRFSKAAQTDE
ncbi:efflux RND transporter permease subunit [Pedosphaera parvula]|uniref:Acriflavin resistance protein n=1 Tax=Pedosphaera parvula (strain Ellin514) TaxID=320771 RepID=B9XPR9_PEDPL|nr:efflux RND transporter permease subunit [Pedosphaera parvula]EEF58192.1 acriflavin resistance protein [Pedosphaera parvula Ellin514]